MNAKMDIPPVQWGDPEKAAEVPESFQQLLQEALGLEQAQPRTLPSPKDVHIPPASLPAKAHAELVELLGPEHVRSDHAVRLRHALGKSYLDIIRYASGRLDYAPDAVVFPADKAQISDLLSWATRHGVAVIPFGGATNVVGGLEGHSPAIAMSLRRLGRVLELDETDGLVTVQPGLLGPDLEAALNPRGFTLGHFPQSFEFSSVGGWLATRSAGQQSTLYGKIEDLVVSMKVVTPAGEIATLRTPAEAAGPDLDQVFCGSEGTLGIIAEATLRLHRLPESRVFACGLFRRFDEGIETVRELLQEGHRPATVRMFDQEETRALGAIGGRGRSAARHTRRWLGELALRAQGLEPGRTCLLILSFEGTAGHTAQASQHAARIITIHRGMPIGPKPGEIWYDTRFELPYLRDRLIQQGILLDTLETATTWGRVQDLHRDVSGAILEALSGSGRRGLVLGHLSHAYPEGASLYFTFLARAEAGQEAGQWLRVQQAALEVILRHGACISHHHGIGRRHAEAFQRQAGQTHLKILRAIKSALDPSNIMNPGQMGI
ncbi:MAG: FAD-binding oxidoreductase [Planctomycetes bacterium]|nr:FAD-binding oxidoreductase [Planctomycetota bacterium]